MAEQSENKYWYLRNHKLFSVLKNSQIEELCIITNYRKAKKNDIIYFADETLKRIYFLKRGRIKIAETDESGNEVIIDILQSGDLFGEISLNSEIKNTEYAQAMSSEVVICTFKLEDFEALIEKYPSVALKFTKLVGFRFRRLENRYSNLVFKDVKKRLNSFLTDWAMREGKQQGSETILENYLTHQDIANLICSTRQTVTQLLNDYENAGVLRYNRKEIIIPNLKKLNL